MTECMPRKRVADREAVIRTMAEEKAAAEAADLAQRHADRERKSLDDPDRPVVLHPAELPEKITVRIVYAHLPGEIIVELEGDRVSSTSQLGSEDYGAAMAGAETALAALGYTLDRYRLYDDGALMVGHFYRKDGPYA